MTNLAAPETFYDLLLDEIASGRGYEAILRLAGMLDAVLLNEQQAIDWRNALLNHPLHQVLQRDEVQVGVVQLGFARGIQARAQLRLLHIEAAWKQGKSILVYDDIGPDDLKSLIGHDLSNIYFEFRARPRVGAKHDLIISTQLAGETPVEKLPNLLGQLAKRLTQKGVLVISSFVPGHLGQGWNTICLGQAPHCHDEAALTAAATAQGLHLTAFRDASNALIWAELRRAPEHLVSEGDLT